MSRSFDAESTVDQVIEGIDLSGKVAVVTGGSGGLGMQTARALLTAGADVTLAVRSLEKGERAADEILQATSKGALSLAELELDRPASVRAFAKRWLAEHDALHLLINNAGVMACPLERTAEGWEMQFATNHVGHFLLTCLLAPALLRGAPARVVNLSSTGHMLGDVRFDDPHFERGEYDKWASYGQSKTANVLFTVELDRRLASRGVRSLAVHPGVIMTELSRHMSPDDIKDLMSRGSADGEQLSFKTPEAGAATSVWAATAPELADMGGIYLEDCRIAKEKLPEQPGGVLPYALDPASAKRLWTLSEELLGEKFDLT